MSLPRKSTADLMLAKYGDNQQQSDVKNELLR